MDGVGAEEPVRVAAESVFAFRIKRTWVQQITISMGSIDRPHPFTNYDHPSLPG